MSNPSLNGLNELACLRIIAGTLLGGGGGTSAPGLPVWTFDPAQTGTPATGHFQLTMIGSDPSTSSVIFLSNKQKNGAVDWEYVANSTAQNLSFQFTDTAGKTYIFTGTQGGSTGTVLRFGGAMTASDSAALSGDYQFNISTLVAQPAQTLDITLSASGITPIADGTYFGITFVKGIAVSAATPIPNGTTTPVTSLTFGSGGAPTAVS